MVKPAFILRLHEESAFADVKPCQVHRLVGASGRSVRLEAVNLHLGRCVIVPAGLGPDWRVVATGAVRLAAEKGLATFRGSYVEVRNGSGFWGRKGQLVIMQGRQPGSDLVLIRIRDRNVAKAGGSCNRPAIGIIKSRVEKRPLATHFQYGHQCIPIGHGAPTASPRVEVVTQKAKSIRNE